jgi:hypothetical protein
MAIEAIGSLIEIIPLNIILCLVSGYFLYYATFLTTKKRSKKQVIFSELKEKEVFARAITIGLFAIILLFFTFITIYPNIFKSCSTQENACIGEIQQTITFLNMLILIFSFALFATRNIYIIEGGQKSKWLLGCLKIIKKALMKSHIKFIITFIITFIIIFGLLLLFGLSYFNISSTNMYYKESVYLEEKGGLYEISFYPKNNEKFEKLLNEIRLECNGSGIPFNHETCLEGLPLIMPPESINKVSCLQENTKNLGSCESIIYVINNFWDEPKEIMDKNLLSQIWTEPS